MATQQQTGWYAARLFNISFNPASIVLALITCDFDIHPEESKSRRMKARKALHKYEPLGGSHSRIKVHEIEEGSDSAFRSLIPTPVQEREVRSALDQLILADETGPAVAQAPPEKAEEDVKSPHSSIKTDPEGEI